MERVKNILVQDTAPSDSKALWLLGKKIYRCINGIWTNIGGGGADTVLTMNVIKITQEEYDALSEKDDNTLYLIVEE